MVGLSTALALAKKNKML
ncbi:hypothetical protein [Candidatus Kinetoplastidibacterium galati]|nr:hypothetical protein [Candidatus Kinetoplastibacterium galatii]